MNILYIANHLNTGGITSYILRLSTMLKKRGHNIFVASSGGELLSEFSAQAIEHIRIPIKTKCEFSPRVFGSLLKLLPLVKEKNINLIHCNSRTTQVVGHLLSRYSGAPYISTCHGFFKPRLGRRIFPCWGKLVIAISEEVKEHLIKDFKVEEGKIRVINHGVDIKSFERYTIYDIRYTKKTLGLGDWLTIGHIGRLSDVKGQKYLVMATKRVLAKFPRAQLLIIGEGRMRQELINLAGKLNINANVFFIPRAQDMQKALCVMDIFVMPSLREGLGLALMDAMAAGRPIVASNVGGIKSLVQDGYNGLLVPAADDSALAEAILRLLVDPEKRKYLGENGRIFIENNFSLEKMVSRTERVYLECAV